MGLFGLGKSKAEKQTDKEYKKRTALIKQNLQIVNHGGSCALTRKQKLEVATEYIQNISKNDRILKALISLKHEIIRHEEYYAYFVELEKYIDNFCTQDNVRDKTALVTIDALILDAIQKCVVQCRHGNQIGVSTYLKILYERIRDHDNPSSYVYYKDEDFYKYTVLCDSYLDIQLTAEAEQANIKSRIDMLKEMFDTQKITENQAEQEMAKLRSKAAELHLRIINATQLLLLYHQVIITIKYKLSFTDSHIDDLLKMFDNINDNSSHTSSFDDVDINDFLNF